MEVSFHKTFKKKYDKLSPKTKEQFKDRLKMFMKDKFEPTLNNHSVGRAYPNCRSINITGDYRAVFEEQNDKVFFITIGTHSELY